MNQRVYERMSDDSTVVSYVIGRHMSYGLLWRQGDKVEDRRRYGVVKFFGDPSVFERVADFALEDEAHRFMRRQRD